jgi:hypothetical protein
VIESAEDWLETPERPTQLIDTEKPADGGLPGVPMLEAATEAREKRAQFIASWESLTESQRVFLNTWRECRFNTNRTIRVLAGTAHAYSKTSVQRWSEIPQYAHVRDLLRTSSIQEILSRDYLAARQEDIVETLLTPKPVLHAGFHTGFYEVEAGAASKANETLLRLGGHMKDKDLEVNVGIVGPQFVIQVVQPDGVVKDITPQGVTIDLPTTAEDNAEWLE